MTDLSLSEKSRAADGLYLLRFEGDQGLLDQFKTPGQYAIIHTSPEQERPAFFALASSPDDPYLEFIIKQAPGAAGDMLELTPGQTVECRSIQGPGFPLSCESGEPDIHMFSMGSGFAPFRSLIRKVAAGESRCKMHLWQAAFKLSAVPLLHEIAQLERDGIISLHLCLDEQTEKTDQVFFAGQVQQALESYEEDLKDSQLLWIGSHEFGESLKRALNHIGVDANRLITNY
ncbi:MAG: hypothetical protein CMN77_07625 [Spirochaetaceae bacterium]|nr:hypothetical protein [Spirochaetaceae bacterium]|tara:strand:- start:10014 stop:10706 length:693 start_codon:yes stop_codon:yes gene_type:complete